MRPLVTGGGGAERPEAGAARRFTAHFGVAPDGIWQAPGRVNLIGEHTDYNDGFALPFAIGARVCAAARARQDGTLVLTSGQSDESETSIGVADLAPGSVSGWAAYPAGVVWAMRTAGYPVGGISLAIDADLKPGAGLSSSAALECAVALALADLHGLTLSRPELALLARHAENDFVGAPTGIMDQMAVLACQQGHALLLDCRSQAGTAVPLAPARSGLALMIIDTRAKHELTDGGYASRRLACEEAAMALGAPALRDIGAADLGRLTDPLLRRRARHVVTENQRVLATAELLGAGQVAEVGPLLNASHASLRDDFEVSWPEADAAVAAAAGAGALGARMTGGGFGGSVIALIRADRAADVRQSVSERFARHGWAAPAFAAAVPSPSAGRVR
jgi:galactokinase